MPKVVTTEGLEALRTTYNAIFNNALENADTSYEEIATVVHSTSKSNTYGNLGALSGYREWIGKRVVNRLIEQSYVVFNRPFENTVGVNRDDYEDDNLVLYPAAIAQMAADGTDLPNDLIFELVKQGFTTNCYDNQPFFDEEHPVNVKYDGSGSNIATSNIVSDDGYTGPTWYMLDTRRPLKPFIMQIRRALQLVTLFNPKDPNVFHDNEFIFGADFRGAAGFGMWQTALAMKCPLTRDNAWRGVERMESFQRDGGKPLKLMPNKIVVPPIKRQAGTKLTERGLDQENGVQVENELKDNFDLIVSSYL